MSEDFNLLWMSVFTIDYNIDDPNIGVIQEKEILRKKNFSEFLKNQFRQIIIDEKYKNFIYNPESKTIQNLEKIIGNENVEENALEIANRLWLVERERSQKISKTLGNELLKGNLVLSHFKFLENNHFVMLKIEHNDFFQDSNFELNSGVPKTKAILKSFFTSYTGVDRTPYQVKIKDKSSAVFWKRDFLDLIEKFDNKKNVKLCFDYLSRQIDIKFSNYKEDRNKLLNSTMYYFCSGRENFDLDDYLDTVLKTHKPISKNISMDDFSTKLKDEIVSKNKFDTYFLLSEIEDIKKIIKPVDYPIRDGLTIRVTKTNNNKLVDVLESIEHNGKRGIIIYNPDDDVYSSYLRKKDDK